MRSLKIMIILFLTVSSVKVFSQCLEPHDIDIFINGYKEIKYLNQYLVETGRTNENVMKYLMDANYLSMFFYRLILKNDISSEELEKNKIIYQNFLDYEIEKEIEFIFTEIGWKNNGHKKYWTIYYGTLCITMMNRSVTNYDEEGNLIIPIDLYSKFTELINDEDFSIINIYIEDIIKTLNKMKN